ncbi:DMT family transporter [Pusillimonas sp.]|uniref:DMT family transporter n=1 Tax=Pusillimonas sp. TaxID=3040095 RepID=UPI0029BF3ABD|nr:DMT family transporter [Pusillimonas sp.]MDX3894318.1 DMT family transporter [Pusillimonas sp.]
MQSLWMLLACAMFAVMGACIKVAADFGASLSQIVLFRGVPSVLLLAVWALGTGRKLRPPSWKLHLWRNLSGITAMWLSFYALSNLPLPTAVSLNYTSPLFITGWMLVSGGAQRDGLRSLAVMLGFLGVIGVLRPSIGQEHFLAGLMGLCSGGLGAAAMLQVRQLGRVGEPEWRTVLIFSSCVCLTSIAGLLAQGWNTPGLTAWLGLVGLGLSGLVGQLAMTRAFGSGSTLLTAALQYTTIIFAAMLGIVFWGDRPDILAWAGMALIIGSGLLSTWRTYTESRKRRSAVRPNRKPA